MPVDDEKVATRSGFSRADAEALGVIFHDVPGGVSGQLPGTSMVFSGPWTQALQQVEDWAKTRKAMGVVDSPVGVVAR